MPFKVYIILKTWNRLNRFSDVTVLYCKEGKVQNKDKDYVYNLAAHSDVT